MRIEELLEQLLFENFNQLKDLYDQVYGDALMKNAYVESLMIDAMMVAEPLNPTFGDPVEVFAFLVRNKQPIVEEDGGSGDPRLRDVNFWVSQFSQAKGKGAAAFSLVQKFLKIIEKSAELAVEKKEFKENKDNYDVLHKGDNWILFEPHHKAASCRLGNDTKWCISSRSQNHFDDYSDRANVYIIHTRNDKYSIIVQNGEIIEVQDSDNDRKQQHFDVHKQFLITLRRDGVDLEILLDKIGVDSGRYSQPNYSIDEIDISDYSASIPAIEGFTVRLFELSGVFSKRNPLLGVVKTNFNIPFYVITLPDAGGDTYFVHEERQGAKFLNAVYFDIMETAEQEGILETSVSVVDDMVQYVVKEEITQEFDSMFDTKNLMKSGKTMLEVALGEHSE